MNFFNLYREFTQFTEAPYSMHVWTAISTLVSCMRRNYYIPFGHIRLYPYLYVVLVGPPGVVQKSTTLGFMMRLLEQFETVYVAADATTPQALIGALEDAEFSITRAGKTEVHHALTVASSEFASFISGADANTMITWLTDLFDREKRFVYRTKTQGANTIYNPFVHLLACTTTTSLARALPYATIGEGLTSRIIFVFDDKKSQSIPIPKAPSTTVENALVNFLDRVIKENRIYVMTDEAVEFWCKWYEEENNEWLPPDTRLIPYKARRHAHILKTAMVLAVGVGAKELTLNCLKAAIKLLELTEVRMVEPFAAVGDNPAAGLAIDILKHLHKSPQTRAQIERQFFNAAELQRVDDTIDELYKMGYIENFQYEGKIFYRAVKGSAALFTTQERALNIGEQMWDLLAELEP